MKKIYIALLAGCVLTLSTIVLVSCPTEIQNLIKPNEDLTSDISSSQGDDSSSSSSQSDESSNSSSSQSDDSSSSSSDQSDDSSSSSSSQSDDSSSSSSSQSDDSSSSSSQSGDSSSSSSDQSDDSSSSSSSQSDDSSSSSSSQGEDIKTYLTVQFNAAQFDTSELAGVYPTFDTDLSGYSFTLTGECNSETYTLYNNVSSDELNSPIELTDDTWNFELRAIKNGTLYTGSVSDFTVETGDNTADFTLTFNANHFDGTATMSLNLTYEQDSYKATRADVFVGETKCENVTVSDEGISLSTTVAAGSSVVSVYFYDSSDNTIDYTYQDTWNWYFYGGKTTSYTGTINLPTPEPPETVYTQYVSTQTPEDQYGFNTTTKLPFGNFQFRGAYATEWTGTYSNYPYDLEFADDGSTITLDGQAFNVVDKKEYWTNSSSAYFQGCVLLNKGDTYLVYKYQYYYTDANQNKKGYVNFWRTKAEFIGTTLPDSAPTFVSSRRTYYPDINYSVLYTEFGIRFDARHSSEDGMSYRWFDVTENTQYIIDFQTHVTSGSATWESLDIPVNGTSTRKGIKAPLYEQFCTMNTRPHEGGGDDGNCPDYVSGLENGEIMYGELIFYRDENNKSHLLFSKALADNTNQKPLYQVQDWLITDEMFDEVVHNFN